MKDEMDPYFLMTWHRCNAGWTKGNCVLRDVNLYVHDEQKKKERSICMFMSFVI
jgi:hypothetical protein